MPRETAAYPNDITAAPDDPVTAPPVTATTNAKRRQTLLTLLDALQELSREDSLVDGTHEANQQPNFEGDHDVPTVDEHLQKVGAEAFHRFQRKINTLDKELRNFSNAARQLGSSVGILSSAFHLRERLTQISYLFRENAADLFPRKISHQQKDALSMKNGAIPHRHTRRKIKAPPHVRRPMVFDKLDPEEFPTQIGKLAHDVITFLHCLNEFPEFTDEAVNASIVAFEGDLKYWASCLKAYEGQFRYPAVQRYLHDLSSEIGDHIDSITTSLSMFIEIGVPTIRFAQKHGASNLLNLSTVATFFSAVTATTLQFSYASVGEPLQDLVNAFWFTSMVFSIAAAVNSLLGLTWKQAMYRSPGHRVPWWVLIWIKRSPLVFLVLSVACFSVGLVLFSYSSGQNPVVCTITTVFTACSSFGLAAVSVWFASERWIFSRHKGQKWLQDSLDDIWERFTTMPPFSWLYTVLLTVYSKISYFFITLAHQTRDGALQTRSAVANLFSRSSSSPNLTMSASESSLPSAGHVPDPVLNSMRSRRGSGTTQFTTTLGGNTSLTFDPKSPTSPTSPTISSTLEFVSEKSPSPGPSSPPATPMSPGRTRFANAVRNVMMMRTMTGASGLDSRHQRTMSNSASGSEGYVRRKERGMTSHLPVRSSRVASLVPKLRGMETTQDLAAHSALVRHLQFSPDGKFLATSSWDRTSVIFNVGDPFTPHRTLAHPQGFVSQVAWSPSGNMLLTKLTRAIKVWTVSGVCTKTIDRHRSVQSICWMPGGEAFMSVEGGDVVKLDLTGKVLDTYHFDRLTIHDVTVTPDGQRLLGVGTLQSSLDGLQPSKCQAEKQIISYNLDKKEIENQVPVLHDIRDITLARNGQFALVSYEYQAPPQLWKLETVKDRSRQTQNDNSVPNSTTRLSLRHTYFPKYPVDFAGHSYFGGKDDQLVLCAGKAGDIHVWDRESGSLLHHIRSQALGGDLTCIAWNPVADPFIFATGSHDGGVRIWTHPKSDPTITGDGTYSPRSSRPVSGAATPRESDEMSIMPGFQLDVDYRTESPTTQQDFDLARSSEDSAVPPSLTRRTIAFTAPEVLKNS